MGEGENIIKIDLTGVGCVDLEWICVAQVLSQSLAVVSTVINLLAP